MDYKQLSAKYDCNYAHMLNDLTVEERKLQLIHAALGLAGETGEVVAIVKKHVMFGKKLDIIHLTEECGDVLYYFGILLNSCGMGHDEVVNFLSNKLQQRFPNGVSRQDAIARKDKL